MLVTEIYHIFPAPYTYSNNSIQKPPSGDLGCKWNFFFFWGGVSLCRPGWSAVAQSQLTATPASLIQAILVPQTSK